MDAIVNTPPLLLQAIFASASELAKATRFVQRIRQLQPDAFARTFCLFLIAHPKASLELLADQLSLSASALAQRLQVPAAASFLLALLRQAIHLFANACLPANTIPLLRRFHGVYLTDSTIVRLPAALAQRFAGYGGGSGPDDSSTAAAAKILLRLRLDSATATELLLEAATTPDIHLLQRLPDLPVGALHIADLGFFDTSYFAELTHKGIFWLSRLPARIQLRVDSGRWQELTDWLRHLEQWGQDRFEGWCEVGRTSPVRARVLVERCPAEPAARRRQKLQERMRRKGTRAGVRQLVLCDWWVLATNTSVEQLPTPAAWQLYRVRWQIELIFKRWKSLGNLVIDPSHAAIRAECELYGKLLAVVAIGWLSTQRGGLLSGRSVWRAWQIVVELLPQLLWALSGRMDWWCVWEELVSRLDKRPQQPLRKRHPSTRQRLFQASLIA